MKVASSSWPATASTLLSSLSITRSKYSASSACANESRLPCFRTTRSTLPLQEPSPNYKLLEHALRSVEFLVVQDGFHPTPPATSPTSFCPWLLRLDHSRVKRSWPERQGGDAPAPSFARFSISGKKFAKRETAFLQGVLRKMGVFVMVFCGVSVVSLWCFCGG
jgi:hypothetical protein